MKKKKQKIIFITTVPETIVLAMEEQIPYLIGRGYEVATICSKGSWIRSRDIESKYGIKAYEVEFKRVISLLDDMFTLIHVTLMLIFLRPDVIHASTPKASLLSLVGGFFARVPLRIYQVRGLVYQDAKGLSKRFWHFLEKVVCYISHIVLVNSESNREFLINNNLCASSKLRILGYGSSHGIDYKVKFNPLNVEKNERELLRNCLNIPNDTIIFGFVGRMVRDKGVADLAAAWQKIATKMSCAHLVLIGPVEEPRDRLPQSCYDYLKSTNSIHISNDTKNARKYYSMFDVFVLPSYREGFPNVVLEAGAMEIPVITTNALGCRDSIIDGLTGLMYTVGDQDALANLMLKLYNDKVLRKKIGKQAREYIMKHYDPQIICEDLHSLIKTHANLNKQT